MDNLSASWKQILWEIVRTAGVAVLIFIGVSCFVTRVEVNGPSMHPTLKDGEALMVWKSHGVIPPRGSIVVVKAEDDNYTHNLVKRLVGLPGDRIVTIEDQVFVNGVLLEEPYAHGARSSATETWDVPENSLFLMGDNRMSSVDSRDWGCLPEENLLGIIFLRYSPISVFGLVR